MKDISLFNLRPSFVPGLVNVGDDRWGERGNDVSTWVAVSRVQQDGDKMNILNKYNLLYSKTFKLLSQMKGKQICVLLSKFLNFSFSGHCDQLSLASKNLAIPLPQTMDNV